jgi:hypothetical protein
MNGDTTRQQMLEEILLHLLQASAAFVWPGVDGLSLQDALESYWDALAAGRVPSRQELCRCYPELSDAIEAFFVLRDPRAKS